MSKLILIIVGAAWLAVLLPPMVRAKLHGSPSNSVSNFRRQLNSLESSGGRSQQGQLRNMARPTLIATPSSLPFKAGIISPIAFEAPVEVGTID